MTNTNPPNPDIPSNSTPALPAPRRPRFAFIPMADGDSPGPALGALLKRPGSIIYRLHQAKPWRLLGGLAFIALFCLAMEGLTVGSFSGGAQWWAAPSKIVGGTLLSALICLPSLYIFACLSGAEITLGPLCGVLLATLCLNALLLIGFAPVAWVFSQSTDSVAFIGALHLAFWLVSMGFALRLLTAHLTFLGVGGRGYLRVWFIVFIFVCLQMTTALRPLVGRSDTFLPTSKRFFLAHWAQNLGGDTPQ